MDNKEKKPTRKDKRIAELEAMLAQQSEQIAMLLANMNTKQTSAVAQPTEDVVVISRNFMDTALESSDGSVTISFRTGEPKYVSVEDMRLLLKEDARHHNRKFFEQGLFYFANEDDYARFKLTKRVDLSPEAVKDIILTENADEMTRKIDALTNKQQNKSILHIFLYEIVEMLEDSSNPLRNWSYDSRAKLEDYVGIKLDTLRARAGVFAILREFHN